MVTDRDTYEIIVDIDGWPASRAALSDVVAGVLGVPAHRIRPVLDVRDEPIATYAHQEEADRIADELAARGIDVVVRRRLRKRKSLKELTRRPVTLLPRTERAADPEPGPPPDKAKPPEAKTMKPGWAALDESGAMSAAGAATAAGLPAWSVIADSGTMASVGSPLASSRASPDQAVQVVRALLDKEATADTVDPCNASEWGEILGSALADRLVAENERRDGATTISEPVAPTVAVTPRLGQTDEVEAFGETLAPAPSATTQHPADLRRGHAGASTPTKARTGDEGSAWSVAGVRVDERPVQSVDSTPSRPDDEPASAAADALVFAGFDEAALAEASEVPQEYLTVGDRFVRLRQPSADDLAGTPEPGVVFAWGLAAPGAGFAALGETSKGFTYLLGSFLLVPWFKGAVDASRFAADVKHGNALLQRKPDPTALFLYVVGFWTVIAAAVVLISTLTSAVPPTPPLDAGIVTIDSGSQTSEAEANSGTEPATAVADVGAELDEGEIRRQLNALIREARMACDEQRYAECERLAGEALDLDGRNRQALILQVEAVSRGVRSVPERPPETENDRQPYRSSP